MASEKVKNIIKQKIEELNLTLSNFMQDGIKRGEIREDIDKHIASICIFATIHQYFLDRIHVRGLEVDEEKDDALLKFILNAIK